MIPSLLWLVIIVGFILMLYFDSDVPNLVATCMRSGLVSAAFTFRWGRTLYLVRYRSGKDTYVMVGQATGLLVTIPLRFFVGGLCALGYISIVALLERFKRRRKQLYMHIYAAYRLHYSEAQFHHLMWL